MRAIARLALVTALLGSLAGAALVYDQGVHVAIPGITRDTVAGRVVDVIDGDTIDVSIDEARNKAFFQLNTKGGAKLIEMVANG